MSPSPDESAQALPISGRIGNWLNPSVSNDLLNIAAAFLVLGYLAVSLAIAVLVPEYPWDLTAYIGVGLKATGLSMAEVHTQAWAIAKAANSPDVFANLSAGDAYRSVQSSDPAAFNSMLPLYSVKVGYVYLLGLLAPHLGWVKSGVILSFAAASLLSATIFTWLKRSRSLQAAPFIVAVLIIGNFDETIRNATPDSLAACLIVAGAWCWVQGGKVAGYGLFLGAFLFRPDTVLFLFALLLAEVIFGGRWIEAAIAFVLGLAASIFIGQIEGHPGWWVHYYFSNVTIQHSLEGFSPAFEITAWLKGQARGVFVSLTEFNWPALLLTQIVALWVLLRHDYQWNHNQRSLLVATVLAIGGKFVVFPLPDDRIYLPFIVVIALVLADIWKPQLGKSPSTVG